MSAMSRIFNRLLELSPGRNRRSLAGTRAVPARGFKPSLEQLDQRILPSLSPATPTAGSPLQGIVELQVTYPDGQTAEGTGALIDSSHVLTAAHLLYSAKDGGYATSVEAIPAANGSQQSFGVAFGTDERVDPPWLSFDQANPGETSPSVEDIGLVTLNRAIGQLTGTFSLGYSNNNSSYAGANFQTAGYPALPGLTGPQMFAESGKSLGVSSDAIGFSQSSLTALPGQSGSPIYQTSAKGTPVIYGVLTGANGFSSSSEVYATRITQSVYTELMSWEKADTTPPVYSSVVSASQVKLQHPAVTMIAPVATATMQKAGTSVTLVQPLDVGWASNPNVYSMFYGDPYYGYLSYTPPDPNSFGNVYAGPQFVQGYGLNYGTENAYSADPYMQFGADFFAYGLSSYTMGLYPDYEWPVEAY